MFIASTFEGIESIIKDRTGKNTIGFGTSVESKKEISQSEIYKQILPQDLLKFGMIPEFIGRLPIIATLKELNREALIKITTEPKNALVKQYKLAGVAAWEKDRETDDVWDIVSEILKIK